MCGIFGVVNGRVSRDKAEECLNKLQHRGPDGDGIYINDEVVLGHRRLAILDLSNNGRQPMESKDGRYVITYNGEIYNFLEVRNELKGLGYSFFSETDTEVILAAYMEWGEEALNRFNGMWAFAIWDKFEKTLFLARDRFGVKPLFYTWLEDGGFAFASEMKALVPVMPKVTADYDLIKSKDIFSYEHTSKCLIKEIKRLPAGYTAKLEHGNLKCKRWWKTIDNIPQIPKRYDEQVEYFRELFLDACKIRMRSDVKIGTALSGGLDSSATICSMAHLAKEQFDERVCKDWQHAFVAAFPNTFLDESKYAKIVTDYLGIPSTFVQIQPERYVDRLEDMLFNFEEIYLTSPIPMMATYEAVKQAGVTVTLDGHGADELFCGYAFDFMAAFPSVNEDRDQIKEIMDCYRYAMTENAQTEGKESADYNAYKMYMLKHKIKNAIRFGYTFQCEDRDNAAWGEMEYLNQLLYTRTHTDILPTLLRNYDRYSMYAGVEIRMPFMDYRIVQMAFALPYSSKLRDGYSKAIIRDALAPYMPQEIVKRRFKIGFNTPIKEWMQGEFKEYFEDIIGSLDFVNSNTVNAKQVKKNIESIIHGGEDITYHQAEAAYKSIAPYLWEKSFLKRVVK